MAPPKRNFRGGHQAAQRQRQPQATAGPSNNQNQAVVDTFRRGLVKDLITHHGRTAMISMMNSLAHRHHNKTFQGFLKENASKFDSDISQASIDHLDVHKLGKVYKKLFWIDNGRDNPWQLFKQCKKFKLPSWTELTTHFIHSRTDFITCSMVTLIWARHLLAAHSAPSVGENIDISWTYQIVISAITQLASIDKGVMDTLNSIDVILKLKTFDPLVIEKLEEFNEKHEKNVNELGDVLNKYKEFINQIQVTTAPLPRFSYFIYTEHIKEKEENGVMVKTKVGKNLSCYGCGSEIAKKYYKFPLNLILTAWEKRKSGPSQPDRMNNTYYHLKRACIDRIHPNFNPIYRVTDEVKRYWENLKDTEKTALEANIRKIGWDGEDANILNAIHRVPVQA